MKKKMMRLISIVMVCAMLTVCGLPVPAMAAGTEQHTIEQRSYPTYFGDPEAELTQPFPLYFLDGVDDLPYVEIDDFAELLYLLNAEYYGDAEYDLTIYHDGNVVTLERENGYTLEMNFDSDKMVFTDYNAFTHGSAETTLLDLLSEKGFDEQGQAQLFQRNKEASFDRYGDVMTVDLAAYGVDMIAQDGGYYVPLQTMNDFLVTPLLAGLVFNGQALILANDHLLFSYAEGDYTELADMYYQAPTGDRSDALAEYSYNELCLAMDTFYGLKEQHDIKSFRQTFWEIGLDEALSGNSASDADEALKAVIDYYLDDLHSVFNEYSYLTGLQGISNSTGTANRKLGEFIDIYDEARKAAYPDGYPKYEEIGNTAYITFDEFSSNYYGEAFYAAVEDGEDLPSDTLGLIIYAHSQITRENSPIENVVLDLSNNLGGAVDAAIFVLGWFLGDVPFSVKDMATGAMSTSVYRADVNLDREFDEKDTVQDKNLYCLISPVSFSCGNLVPAALKSSQKVTLLGKTSGGGSCTVFPMTTAYGTVFQISGRTRMSFLKNGSFYDIDQGVAPDYYINSTENFYNRTALTEFINNLY